MKTVLASLLTAFCCLQTLVAQTPPVPYGNNPAVGKYYDINGIKLYCEEYGEGEPLLLLHGNGGSISAFSNNIPYLAKKYRVIAVDSRAQGKSVDDGDNLTFEMMADDFAALLDAMHIDSAYVIGWSDGGIDALLLAMRHPEKVRKLVSTGANLWPSADAFAPGVWDAFTAEHDAGIKKAWTTQAEKNHWKLFLLDWNHPHIALKDLHAIQCPSLIVCGDHDMIPVEHTTLIYQNIPKAYLWVVPNSGHATLAEHRDEFNRKADEFFSTPFHERK